MEADEVLLGAFDQKREQLNAATLEAQKKRLELMEANEKALQDLRERADRIYKAINPNNRVSMPTQWVSLGDVEGRDDAEILIRAEASVDSSLDVDVKIADKVKPTVCVVEQMFMSFYPNRIYDNGNNEITPYQEQWGNAVEVITALEKSLGIDEQEQ